MIKVKCFASPLPVVPNVSASLIMKALVVLLEFVSITSCITSGWQEYPWRIFLRSVGGINQTYIVHDAGYTYHESKEWCDSLGGHLPIIHSQEDLDFLTLKVIGKDSKGFTGYTWTGLTPVSTSSQCPSVWLDGSHVTSPLNSYIGYGCSNCSPGCCAMSVSSSGLLYHFQTMFFLPCSHLHRKVCVIPGDYMTELTKVKNRKLTSPNRASIPILIVLTFLTILTVIILWIYRNEILIFMRMQRMRVNESFAHFIVFRRGEGELPTSSIEQNTPTRSQSCKIDDTV